MTVVEDLNADWWTCKCGNDPAHDGFYTCLEDGSFISPDANGPWDGYLYLCYHCGAIVQTQADGSGVIIGQASPEVRKNNLQYDWDTY